MLNELEKIVKPSKRFSQQKKLTVMVEYLTEGHLDTDGGYPYDCQWFKDHLFVAALDHDEATVLNVYKKAGLLDWFDLAVDYTREYACDNFLDAIQETEADADAEIRGEQLR